LPLPVQQLAIERHVTGSYSNATSYRVEKSCFARACTHVKCS